MNWDDKNIELVIWRRISLTRPIQINGAYSDMILGENVKSHFDSTFSNIYDTGEAKAYLRTSR
jgi:hypothetical protein